ncbi:MAG: SGNH/GDSL hydrolase family protein [Candidatus Omnitrophica bacterium]|nr:SGNH/GDSL hydrolase family protein [Candidatus Omnitrophota bacterium]MDD5592673.1 SGNH/GDSL hydrolase family protein [Candidatus Omnitrophota bacterium]
MEERQKFRIYTVGDSHSWHPWNNFPFVSYNTLGSYTMFRLGRDKDIIVKDFPADCPVCFCFGEIDCRCHVGKHPPWKSTVEMLVEKYFEAIELNRKINPNIWVYSIPPPPRRTDTWENPDVPFVSSDYERLAYQRYMNELLRKGPFLVVDIADDYADAEGFMCKDLGDKHVHYESPAPLAAWLKSKGYF